MTFDESKINRKEDGKFGAKEGWPPDPDVLNALSKPSSDVFNENRPLTREEDDMAQRDIRTLNSMYYKGYDDVSLAEEEAEPVQVQPVAPTEKKGFFGSRSSKKGQRDKVNDSWD